MLVLAIDHSTPEGSLALVNAGTVIAQRTWQQAPRAQSLLPMLLRDILAEKGLTPAELDGFAVGLGPGRYSSLRTSLSTINGLALPGRRPVRGVCSARALAYDARQEEAQGDLVVVGDARRDRVWFARYRGDAEAVISGDDDHPGDCRLLPITELPQHLHPGDRLLSPDWDRLAVPLAGLLPAGVIAPSAPRTPRAGSVAHLAVREGLSAESRPKPLSPIYMHPAVFVPPRF